MIDVEKFREKRLAYQRKYVAKAKLAYAAFIKHFPLDPTSLADEIWKDIEGYEGEYQISNYSRVKSFKWGFPKILKPELCGVYLAVHLLLNGKPQHFSVHVLAARAFIPNPENKPLVNHVDGNKLNCHISNLQWVTPAENLEHAIRTGLKKQPQGLDDPRAVLKENQVLEILDTCVPGDKEFGIAALARKFGVGESTIRRVVQGKSYKNVPRDVDKSDEKS